MDDQESTLPPNRCPRLVAVGTTFDFSSFCDEFGVAADFVWRPGEPTPFDFESSVIGGFAVYLTKVASQLWEQEQDLEDYCVNHFQALSLLRDEGVKLHAVLFPYKLSGAPAVCLRASLLVILGGLGVELTVEVAQHG
jgi:hypothetical protein